jgi:hypothetical protein
MKIILIDLKNSKCEREKSEREAVSDKVQTNNLHTIS